MMPVSFNGEPPYTPTYTVVFGCLLGGEENSFRTLSYTGRQLSAQLCGFFIPVIAFEILW